MHVLNLGLRSCLHRLDSTNTSADFQDTNTTSHQINDPCMGSLRISDLFRGANKTRQSITQLLTLLMWGRMLLLPARVSWFLNFSSPLCPTVVPSYLVSRCCIHLNQSPLLTLDLQPANLIIQSLLSLLF